MNTVQSLKPTPQESKSTSTISKELADSFQSHEYRHAFLEESIKDRLTTQIRTMREAKGWDYKQFAKELNKKLAWPYRLEDPNETLPTLPTLLEIASVFDVALDVRFVPFSAVRRDLSELSPTSFNVSSFGEEENIESREGDINRKTPIIP